MRCPSCGSEDATEVTKTRRYEDRIYRRRKCQKCGYRFTTDERPREAEDSEDRRE